MPGIYSLLYVSRCAIAPDDHAAQPEAAGGSDDGLATAIDVPVAIHSFDLVDQRL